MTDSSGSRIVAQDRYTVATARPEPGIRTAGLDVLRRSSDSGYAIRARLLAFEQGLEEVNCICHAGETWQLRAISTGIRVRGV